MTDWKPGDLIVCDTGDVPWAIVTDILHTDRTLKEISRYNIMYPSPSDRVSGAVAHTHIDVEHADEWRLYRPPSDYAAQLRAAIAFIYPDDMTPSAKRVLESIAEQWENPNG